LNSVMIPGCLDVYIIVIVESFSQDFYSRNFDGTYSNVNGISVLMMHYPDVGIPASAGYSFSGY